MPITSDQMAAAIEKAYVNAGRLNDVVNGPDTMDVPVDNGVVPTLAKFFKGVDEDVDARIDAAVGQLSSAFAVLLNVSADGVADEFTLSAPVSSVNGHLNINVQVGGTPQPKDGVAYTVIDSGSKIKLSEVPVAGTRVYAEGAAVFTGSASITIDSSYAFASEAEFALTTINAAVNTVVLGGYTTLGDGGGHVKRRITPPDPVRLWHKQSADGAWWEIMADVVHSRMLGAVGDDLTNEEALLQAAVDFATLKGVKCIIDNGYYNCPNLNTPSNCFIEFAPNAWLRPRTHSNVGAIISNVNVLPKTRENITLVNPQVDGRYLPFTGTTNANDNGIGFATGVSKIRIIGGHVKTMRANFQDGPGGKGVGFEEGVNDVLVLGTKIEDCTYATFVSPTLNNPLKYCWDISFSDLIIERCAAVAWLLSDETTPGALPTPEPAKCSASYYNISAKDVGHFPDRPVATYRAKTGPILLQGFSNLIMRGVRIYNTPGYPSADAPAGGTQFPAGYPAAGTTFFGAGLSGPIGSVLWGFGRNIDIDVDFTGDSDDVWNIQRCRAHAGDAFGGVIAPVGASGNVIRIVKRGAGDGLINSGVVGTTGTLTAATSTTVTFPNTANIATRDDAYAGVTVTITGGTGSGQSGVVGSYVGSTRVATMQTAWGVTPDATSTFSLGSTLAVADGNITGRVEIYADTPAKELVNNWARFPTGLHLTAHSPAGVVISGSLSEVFATRNAFSLGSTNQSAPWVPAPVAGTNVAAVSGNNANYLKLGDVVFVSGFVTVDPTAAGATLFDVPPPIALDFTTTTQAAGVFHDNGGEGGYFYSDPTTNNLRFSFTATNTASRLFGFSGSYSLV